MNLVQRAVQAGGVLAPLVIPSEETGGTGLMNPSVLSYNDMLFVNLRHVNYTLYHSEGNQLFPSRWGPMAYLHPETDMHLKTTNFFCELRTDNLQIIHYDKVDTSELDWDQPLWDFWGLEDARIARWDDKVYLIGVRRDTTPNGQGRMEYSELLFENGVKEVARHRMPTPPPDDSYCEKNWVPIEDQPYTFVKWHHPVEIVKSVPGTDTTTQVALKESPTPPRDLRGGSQVVRWGDGYISVTHEVSLFPNYLGLKDGIYRHRLIVWDKDMNLIGFSPEDWSFLDGRVEFCSGAAVHNGDLILTFGFQDNTAFALRVPNTVVNEMIAEATA